MLIVSQGVFRSRKDSRIEHRTDCKPIRWFVEEEKECYKIEVKGSEVDMEKCQRMAKVEDTEWNAYENGRKWVILHKTT